MMNKVNAKHVRAQTGQCGTVQHSRKRLHLKYVNGRLMDGADNRPSSVDNIPDCAHDDGSSTGVQACRGITQGQIAVLRSEHVRKVHPCSAVVLNQVKRAAEWPQGQNSGMLCSGASGAESLCAGRGTPGAYDSPYGLPLQHPPDVGSSMNTIEGLATCKAAEACQATMCAPSSSSC